MKYAEYAEYTDYAEYEKYAEYAEYADYANGEFWVQILALSSQFRMSVRHRDISHFIDNLMV